jgi:hypothetical protein
LNRLETVIVQLGSPKERMASRLLRDSSLLDSAQGRSG